MQVCYIDESGDTGKFVPEVANSQPLFVLSGVIVDQSALPAMTRAVIELKRKFFPNHGSLNAHWHDWLKSEVKGSYLRQMLREGNRDQRRLVMMFLGKVVELLERNRCSVLSRVYLKAANADFNGTNVYTAAIQHFVTDFKHRLRESGERGVVILDSRNKIKNVPVSHAIFTQNFSGDHEPYRELVELPLFGHSENHALIQIADWISSAFFFPMAAIAYYREIEPTSLHVHVNYDLLRQKFGQRLKALQYRYESNGRKMGGVRIVSGEAHKVNLLDIFGALQATQG